MPIRPLLFAALLACSTVHAAEVHVAVASNFTAPMQKLAAAFEQASGHRALLSFGATGKFYAQISNGAPFDVLLSADDETAARLASEGKALAASRFTYAIGRLVLWSARADYIGNDARALDKPDLTHLAIANPRTAPYGAAAIDVLKAVGRHERLQGRFVQGENITQAYQFVASGNAQAGFVAMAQVFEDGRLKSGSGWVVPANLHAPIRQDAILLAKGAQNPAAAALLKYLASAPARAIIRQYGYDL